MAPHRRVDRGELTGTEEPDPVAQVEFEGIDGSGVSMHQSLLHRLPIKSRLLVAIALAAAGMLTIIILDLRSLHANLLADRQEQTRNLVRASGDVVRAIHQRANAAGMTEDDAKTMALEALRAIRYGDNDYIFVIGQEDLRVIMHPIDPSLDGRVMAGYVDTYGVPLFQRLGKAAADGGGFVVYHWPRPGSTDPVKKLSYAAAYEPWGWLIGTGLYIDAVDTIFWGNMKTGGAVTVISMLAAIGLLLVVAQTVVRPLRTLTATVAALAHGDTDRTVPFTTLKDEVGAIARAVEVFRQHALENERLRHAKQITDLELKLRDYRRIQALGTLAGGLAHEINNALLPIYGFSEMVHDGLPPDSPDRDCMKRILQSAMAAGNLIDRLLLFNRSMDDGAHGAALGSIVEGLAMRLQDRLAASGVRPRVEVRDRSDALQIHGDAEYIGRAVESLLDNAVDATSSTSGTIAISLDPVSLTSDDLQAAELPAGLSPGDYIRLRIADTGCGMEEHVRQRAFEPLFTTKDVGQGKGIGLSMAYAIVSCIGGGIVLRSIKGMGTTADVFLPVLGQRQDSALAHQQAGALRAKLEPLPESSAPT